MKTFFDYFLNVTNKEFHTFIKDKFLNEDLINTIKYIYERDKTVVFCGSLGLVLNGMLFRPVKDIDILTEQDHYQDGTYLIEKEGEIRESSDSGIFYVDDIKVKSFKLKILNSIIDVLFSSKVTEYQIIRFEDMDLRVEKPEFAISFKERYNNRNGNLKKEKHDEDLKNMGVNRKNKIHTPINNSYKDDLPF